MQAGDLMEKPAVAPCVMSPESIAEYIQQETDGGASENALRRFRRFTKSVYDWLPEDKALTKERLLAWRQSLKDRGYSPDTELNYIKGVNRYLDCIGRPDLRFGRGRAKDIAGMQFGYLTALEPTGQKDRRDLVWRCVCRCGREVEYPATRLLTGHSMSCGCLRSEHLRQVNKYCAGTSLRQAMDEQVRSTRAVSGYTGVTPKGGKWKAYIKYKGQCISLGCYTRLEDAVKARARGKELVRLDALGLLDIYEELHKNDPARPDRAAVRNRQELPAEPKAKPEAPALRSNNTSGCPGVFRKRSKWAAKITYRKTTCQLGVFENRDDAVAARKEAERALKENPESFPAWAAQRRQCRQQEALSL